MKNETLHKAIHDHPLGRRNVLGRGNVWEGGVFQKECLGGKSVREDGCLGRRIVWEEGMFWQECLERRSVWEGGVFGRTAVSEGKKRGNVVK